MIKINKNTGLAEDVKVKVTDMILPATLLFLLFYFPLCLFLAALGSKNIIINNLILIFIFGAICGLLFWVKYYRTMNNLPITDMVTLIDANVGVQFLNWGLVIIAAVAAVVCIVSGHGILFAAFLAIIFGFCANQPIGQKLWDLEEPSAVWIPHHRPDFTPKAPSAPQGKKLVTRKFSWSLILSEMGISHTGADYVEVMFAEPDYTDENSSDYVRAQNPFYHDQPATEEDYTSMAAVVKNGSSDPLEKTAISQIIDSAEKLCDKYNLADYQMYDLLLRFCQHCIEYKIDDQSIPIKQIMEYFRFPGETLFDMEGDCDCKSVLAYSLFSMLGADVDIVTVRVANENSEDGYNSHAAIILKDSNQDVKLPPQYPKTNLKGIGKVVFCEATGEGFSPGAVSSGADMDSIRIV